MSREVTEQEKELIKKQMEKYYITPTFEECEVSIAVTNGNILCKKNNRLICSVSQDGEIKFPAHIKKNPEFYSLPPEEREAIKNEKGNKKGLSKSEKYQQNIQRLASLYDEESDKKIKERIKNIKQLNESIVELTTRNDNKYMCLGDSNVVFYDVVSTAKLIKNKSDVQYTVKIKPVSEWIHSASAIEIEVKHFDVEGLEQELTEYIQNTNFEVKIKKRSYLENVLNQKFSCYSFPIMNLNIAKYTHYASCVSQIISKIPFYFLKNWRQYALCFLNEGYIHIDYCGFAFWYDFESGELLESIGFDKYKAICEYVNKNSNDIIEIISFLEFDDKFSTKILIEEKGVKLYWRNEDGKIKSDVMNPNDISIDSFISKIDGLTKEYYETTKKNIKEEELRFYESKSYGNITAKCILKLLNCNYKKLTEKMIINNLLGKYQQYYSNVVDIKESGELNGVPEYFVKKVIRTLEIEKYIESEYHNGKYGEYYTYVITKDGQHLLKLPYRDMQLKTDDDFIKLFKKNGTNIDDINENILDHYALIVLYANDIKRLFSKNQKFIEYTSANILNAKTSEEYNYWMFVQKLLV